MAESRDADGSKVVDQRPATARLWSCETNLDSWQMSISVTGVQASCTWIMFYTENNIKPESLKRLQTSTKADDPPFLTIQRR